MPTERIDPSTPEGVEKLRRAFLSVHKSFITESAKALQRTKDGGAVTMAEIRDALEVFSNFGRDYSFEKHYEGGEIGRTELCNDRTGVYVLYAPIIGRYKIGFSATPAKRMADIQTTCPVELESVAFFEGDMPLESWLHRRYSQYRVIGEWFDFPDYIAAALYGLSE